MIKLCINGISINYITKFNRDLENFHTSCFDSNIYDSSHENDIIIYQIWELLCWYPKGCLIENQNANPIISSWNVQVLGEKICNVPGTVFFVLSMSPFKKIGTIKLIFN